MLDVAVTELLAQRERLPPAEAPLAYLAGLVRLADLSPADLEAAKATADITWPDGHQALACARQVVDAAGAESDMQVLLRESR